MNPRTIKNQNGFTLIEVTTVLILVAFLSIAFLTYYKHIDTDLMAQTQILKANLRYAQARAMNTNTRWGIRLDAVQRAYWLFKDPDTEDPIALPGQTQISVDLVEMGLHITGTNFNVTFDEWGQPILTDRTFTDGLLTFNLNRGGIDGDDITLTANTGFIP